MTLSTSLKLFERFRQLKLERLPGLGFYARARGWPFVLAWGHRIAGIILVLYAWLHIYTLSLLPSPDRFNSQMKLFQFFLFVILEWALAFPVIFHALNGGRMILYESFGNRNDTAAIRWVLGLAAVYVLFIGMMMAKGDQVVSPVFFWLGMLIFSMGLSYAAARRIWRSGNSSGWKLQRISGCFLIIMIPAHLLFMHLQPSIGHDAIQIQARMRHLLIKVVDVFLVAATLYHGGYGVVSIIREYTAARWVKTLGTCLVSLVMLFFGWMGIRLIMTI